VFQTMKIDMLSKMVPFFDFAVVEKISVDAVKYNYVAMKVDHLNGAVIFGNVVCQILFMFFVKKNLF
jgi:translation initiation factor 3 subunit A